MNVLPALIALAILVVLSAIVGVIIKLTQTRVRRIADDQTVTVTREDLTPSVADFRDFGDRLTFLQFSTQACTRCPATSRVLGTVAGRTPDVSHIDIDVTSRDDLIEKFSVLRTPTVLVLDRDGKVRTRVTGPISIDQARTLVTETLAPEPSGRAK